MRAHAHRLDAEQLGHLRCGEAPELHEVEDLPLSPRQLFEEDMEHVAQLLPFSHFRRIIRGLGHELQIGFGVFHQTCSAGPLAVAVRCRIARHRVQPGAEPGIGLEGLHLLDHLNQHVLCEIVGLRGVPCVDQCPAVHHGVRALGKRPERPLVTLSGPVYQVRGKLERVITHAFSPCVVILVMGRRVPRWRLPVGPT